MYSRFPLRYRAEAERYYSDWRLILAMIKAESGFDPNAVSSVGACGLMQLMPETATFIAAKEGIEHFDLFSATDNLRLGCKYLLYLETRFSDRDAVLAAYNAGEGNVREWLRQEKYSKDGKTLNDLPFSETKNYLKKVKKYYRIYGRIYLTKK